MNEKAGEGLAPSLDDNELMMTIYGALESLKDNKPNDRSEKDRRFAIMITDMEKIFSYFKTWIYDYK